MISQHSLLNIHHLGSLIWNILKIESSSASPTAPSKHPDIGSKITSINTKIWSFRMNLFQTKREINHFPTGISLRLVGHQGYLETRLLVHHWMALCHPIRHCSNAGKPLLSVCCVSCPCFWVIDCELTNQHDWVTVGDFSFVF